MGSTIRVLKTQIAEHRVTSPVQGTLLIAQSSVGNHYKSRGMGVNSEHFQIVSGSESLVGLRIVELL